MPDFDQTESIPGNPTVPPGHGGGPPPNTIITIQDSFLLAGFSIWTWDATLLVWALVEDKSGADFEPGDGPTGPGRFHGQTVRWASVPSTS